MKPTSDPTLVANSIGDKVLNHWWNSDVMKNSQIGRTAHQVEKSLKTEVSIKPNRPEAVEHKVSFQFLALQAKSKVEYLGWWNSVASYNARSKIAEFEIKQKLFTNKDVSLKRIISSAEVIDQVGISWGF